MAEMFWMTAKRDGCCGECEGDIREGERMVYEPDAFRAYCAACGAEAIGNDPVAERDELKKKADEVRRTGKLRD